jgi:hypothetical protein
MRIRNQLGPCVLLAIALGEKRPRTTGWQKLTLADMTPGYLASLNYGQNIGVLLGGPSEGLCTIDADGDEYLKELLALNPGLHETLTSKGERGGNIWLRIRGPYPPSGRIKTLQGAGFGEWRADGNQTVIYGRHPSGRDYSNNGKRPLAIEFTEIIWPEHVLLPWKEKGPDIYDGLIHQYGQPYSVNPMGSIQVNQMFFVGRFAVEHLVLHEPNERDFYIYDAESGSWLPRTPDSTSH